MPSKGSGPSRSLQPESLGVAQVWANQSGGAKSAGWRKCREASAGRKSGNTTAAADGRSAGGKHHYEKRISRKEHDGGPGSEANAIRRRHRRGARKKWRSFFSGWTLFKNPFNRGAESRTPAPISPVQPELWLDKVKPVRNDLSDSDIEVVQPPCRLPSCSPRQHPSRFPPTPCPRPCPSKRAGAGSQAVSRYRKILNPPRSMRGAKFLQSQTSPVGGDAGNAQARAGRALRRRHARWGWTRGSHLAASTPNGWLSGCDRDGAAIEAATRRLMDAGFAGRFDIRRGNFSEMADWIPPASCDGCCWIWA